MTRRTRILAAGAGLRRWAALCVGLALILTVLPGAAAVASDKIVLQLHGPPQFEFAGYYAALWRGFYREAGLDVEIRAGAAPGAAPVDPVRAVIERRANFGTGTAELLIRTAQGAPLLLLGPIFQESGTAVYHRSDANFASPRALLNASIGRLPPSNTLDAEFRAVLHSEGIDADKLKSVSIEAGQALAALADHRVDAVVGSAWELPWRARARSVALKALSLAAYRPPFYGDGLFTLQRFANADPATVQSFRDASIKGWQYALQHPDEIAGRIAAELSVPASVADAVAFVRYQSEVARRLAHFPDVPLGQSSPERWSEIEQGLIAVGAMSRSADFDAFLYKPGAQSSDFSSRLALLTLSAVVVFALCAAAGRWLWKRYRACAIPNIGPTDLNAVLGGLEASIRKRLRRGVTCRFSQLPDVWVCETDPAALSSLILDLVAEAVAFMPIGGELVVGTRQYTFDNKMTAEFPGSAPGDYVRVTVRDSGRGLSEAGLERVFYLNGSARPAAAAAWELMRQFGGFAAVESAEGCGTAVHLYFRRAVVQREAAKVPDADDVAALAAE